MYKTERICTVFSLPKTNQNYKEAKKTAGIIKESHELLIKTCHKANLRTGI